MNKSSVPGERLVDERAEYVGGSEIAGGVDRFGRTPDQIRRDRKPYLYPNGRVDVEALQELEARVLSLEAEQSGILTRLDCIESPSLNEHDEAVHGDKPGQYTATGEMIKNMKANNVLPHFTATLEALLEKHNILSVTDNSREYYEQQIEDLSEQWQSTKETLNDRDILVTSLLERSRSTASTIADLREKLEGWKSALGQRDAIIAEKNREIAEARDTIRSIGELNACLTIDANLGALVRQMPPKCMLRNETEDRPEWWVQKIGRLGFERAGSPEEVLLKIPLLNGHKEARE